MCHSGVGLTSVLEGRELHLSAGGLYNGLVQLIDDETLTYWDHITGEAVHGPLEGARLETWPLHYLDVASALARWPELKVSLKGRRGLLDRMMGVVAGSVRGALEFLPPGFRSTMADVDPALPEMTPGLAVLHGEDARFYPMEVVSRGISDPWDGGTLRVSMDATEGFADATWVEADRERPMQLMMRWYGFNLTWPHGKAVQ